MGKEDLIFEEKYFGFLSKIINNNNLGSQKYTDFLTDETARVTGSDASYLFETGPGSKKVILLAAKNPGEEELDILYEKVFRELAHSVLLGGKVAMGSFYVILDLNSEFDVRRFDTTGKISGQVFLVPFGDGVISNGVMILTRKSGDYNKVEAGNFAELLSLAWPVLLRIRESEELVKQKELAENTGKQNGRLMLNISQDIRTPVNAIVGFANLMTDTDHPSEIRKKYVNIIINSSEELLSLTRDFSEIANLEFNLKRTRRQSVDLHKIFHLLNENFESRVNAKNLTFSIKPDLKEDEHVMNTDKTKLLQILNTLTANALKNTYSGGIEISCRRKNDSIEFQVTDTGIGISLSRSNRLSEVLTPGESIFSGSAEGFDAAMAVSYAYIRHLGGDLWYTSAEGEGTDFFFTLPFEPGTGGAADNGFKDEKPEETSRKERVILVAEDDENNYSLIECILVKNNYKVLHASNGRDAVEICRTNNVDLVFMDIKMPVMDGYTAAKLILEMNPGQKIIAQTAYQGDRPHALSKGCVDFIAKPFSRQQLLSVISSYV